MEQVESAWGTFEASPYFWDVIALVCLMLCVLGFLTLLVWILGLPGRIAVARNHPDAEAVYTMGWVGFLAIVPWIQALIWAFKPTDKIDIRYFPEQERLAEEEDLRRLSRYAFGRDLSPENLEKLRRRAGAAASDPAAALAAGEDPSPPSDTPTGGARPDPDTRES